MKKVLLSLSIAIGAFAMEPIVSVDWLSKNLDNKNLRIVEVSSEESYVLSHIPNATHTTIAKWRGDNGTYALLKELDVIEKEIRSHNIDKNTQVVIYADILSPIDFLKTSYIFWALHYVGVEKVALLDGGKQAWNKAKGTLTQQETTLKESDFKAVANPKLIASKDYVLKNLGKIPMVDARPGDNYLGITPTNGVKRDGHIKGAMSYSWNYSVNQDYMLKDKSKLDALFSDGYNLDKNKEVLVYCTGGLEASYNYFVLAGVLGYKNIRLYDASMKEWGNTDTTPMTKYKYENFKK